MVTVSESTSLDFCEYLWIIWNNELSYIMVEKLIDVKLITAKLTRYKSSEIWKYILENLFWTLATL